MAAGHERLSLTIGSSRRAARRRLDPSKAISTLVPYGTVFRRR